MKNEASKLNLPDNSSSIPGRRESAPENLSLEEVRKRLQSFGYLNSRIERFYFSSLSRSASLFLNRLLLSFRVGLLAGSISALIMAAGTLLFNEVLLKNKSDLLLLFLYLEAFFIFCFSLLEMMLIYFVWMVLRFTAGRKLYPAGQGISFLLGLGFWGYFFYWGFSQSENLRFVSQTVVGLFFAIVFFAGIFVARCSWLGFLVAFWQADLQRVAPDWRRYGVETALVVAALLGLVIFVTGKRGNGNVESFPVAVVTTADRWLVLAIDGMPSTYLKRFSDTGDLPYITELSRDSVMFRIHVGERIVPPVTWTTIATGVPPAEHGILLPEVRRLGGIRSWMQVTPFQLALYSLLGQSGLGQRQPVSGYVRKVRSFWEILSDSGMKVGVANWWGSWPATKIRGWMISERYFYKKISGGNPHNETYPPELFFHFSTPPVSTIRGPDLDQFYMNLFRKQLKEEPVRVAALYLPGLDILNYEFFEKRSMDPFQYTGLYRDHLKWLDQQLEMLNRENPDFRVMVIFYQGRSFSGDQSAVLIRHPQASGARKSVVVSDTDLIPLLLHSCGLPISRSMSMNLIYALYPSSVLTSNPIRFVSGFPQKQDPIEPSHADEFNDILVEQMKSLGYLQ